MRPFTAEEKEHYLNQLSQKGKAIFSKYGIKKTTVAELAKAAGIAKGSFYLFFESKEALYFYILTEEISGLRQNAMSKIMQRNQEPYLLVTEFLNGIIESIQANPIIGIAVSQEGRELFEREAIKTELKQDGEIITGLRALLAELIDNGIVISQNTNLLMNLLRTLFIVISNKEKLDEAYFDETIAFMIDSIAKGIAVS